MAVVHVFLALAAVAAAAVSPLHGRTIAIDPGHNGRNWAHPREIDRLVEALAS